MEFMEFSAKTVNDCITNACQKFVVTSDKLEYEVITEGSTGFLGFNSKPAIIKARVKSSVDETVKEFLNKVFDAGISYLIIGFASVILSIIGQIGDFSASVIKRYFEVKDFSHGVHNLQYRAYVVVNGENFYTDIIYTEFMVYKDNSDINPMIAINTTIPKEVGIVDSIQLYNVVQYELYSITYGVYNPKHLEYIPIEIYLDDVLATTVNASNNKELTYSFTAATSGNKIIIFKSRKN